MMPFQFPPAVQRSIFVCTVARSRSTLFCDALALTGRLGEPAEWFNDYLLDRTCAEYGLLRHGNPGLLLLATIDRATDERGVFAVKAIDQYFFRLCEHFRRMHGLPGDAPLWELLAPYFPNPHFIFWTRSSKLRQAISFEKAQQGGRWHSHTAENPRISSGLHYDGFYIRWAMNEIEKNERQWRAFFEANQLPVLEVSDEALLADYAGTIRRVGEYVGMDMAELEIDPSDNPREAVADRINDFWEELYRGEVEEGFPADYNDASNHWSNLTHRLWIDVEPTIEGTLHGAVNFPVRVLNQRQEAFQLLNSKGPAPAAAIRVLWVSKENPWRRIIAYDAPLPVQWDPGQVHEVEVFLDSTMLAQDHNLVLLCVVKDESWVRMNGINAPQVGIEVPRH